MVDDGKSIPPDAAAPFSKPASVDMKELVSLAPLHTRFWWWMLSKLNITSADSFLGLVDIIGKQEALLKSYLELNDKAWGNQNRFNGMVKDILNVADANSKPREKELEDKGVYQ